MRLSSSKTFLYIMGLIASWLISYAYADQEMSAKSLLERCTKEGSVAVVNELTLDDEWKQVTDKIATGDDEWVDAAGCLSHGVYLGDDEWAIDLFNPALAEALRKNTNAVLGFEHSGVSLRYVCSLPFFEEDLAFLNDYIEQVSPILDEKTVIGRRINIDHAEICAIRMRDAYERRKAEIREREEAKLRRPPK